MNTPVYLSLHLLLEVGLFPLSDYCDCNVCWFTNLFESLFLILLSVYLGVELLNHVIILCLAFWGTVILFSTVWNGYTILHSFQQGIRVPISPYPHQYLLFCFVFDNSHPNKYWVVSRSGLNLNFSAVKHYFMCLLAICTSSL